MVNIDDFSKIEMRVGTVLQAEEVEGSEKLWKLTVDLGLTGVISNDSEKSPEESDSSPAAQNDGKEGRRDIRTVLSGIKQWYSSDELVGKQFVFVSNLEPRAMMGMESQGMIMAAEGEEKPILLMPQEKIANGAKIR